MTISMDKKYRTRGGRDVRVLCVDAPGLFPVVGYYFIGGVGPSVTTRAWRADGRTNRAEDIDNVHDLIEVRPAEDVVREVLSREYQLSPSGGAATIGAHVVCRALREAGMLKEDAQP